MLKTKIQSKKLIFIAVAVILVLVVAGSYAYKNRQNNNNTGSSQPIAQQDPINYDPPTEEDAQRVDANKQDIVNNQEALKNYQAPQPGSKKDIKPIISYAGQYDNNVEVGGYINGIFEEGGTCLATFTRGALTVTKSVAAVTNVNAVDCPAMIISINEFQQKGSWDVTITYTSPNASGISDKKTLEVK